MYLPDGGSVTVNLAATAGTLNVEWFNPRTGAVTNGGIKAGGSSASFSAPDTSGDWVLYLKRI